jgi:hypothetical protein
VDTVVAAAAAGVVDTDTVVDMVDTEEGTVDMAAAAVDRAMEKVVSIIFPQIYSISKHLILHGNDCLCSEVHFFS